ncbi:MAG: hypothetical protein Q7U20_00355, partial [Caulobacter sp.]|nr:hypothetical protein [Caulobacter sp.]
GLFGSSGWITAHSKSVRSNRAISTSILRRLNQPSPDLGIPFMGMWPKAPIHDRAKDQDRRRAQVNRGADHAEHE